jgi:hypothetical protein
MRRSRPGITLVEVLISLFIMAIGLLSLLTLFLTGALSMGQSLQADRAAAAAQIAAESAEVMALRHDPAVTAAFATPPPGGTGGDWPVFVDAFGAAVNPAPLGAGPTPGVPRVQPSYARTTPLAARWFSLLDDVTFGEDGKPPSGPVQRGGRFTWAYLLRRPRADRPEAVDLSVVVYAGRDTQTGTGETVYLASGNKGEAGLLLSYTAAQGKPALRGGGWVLDVSPEEAGTAPRTRPPRAVFHRVAGVADTRGGLYLEVEPELQGPVSAVVVLDNAVEVFRLGTGRAP